MKKVIIFLLLISSTLVFAQNTWYVKPEGNDANDGVDSTDAHAWKTWGKAFNSTDVDPGDTVYFMGGIYMMAYGEGNYYHADGKSYRIDRGGTPGNLVHYWAYPGEEPILDCGNLVTGTNHIYAIRGGASYSHYKGLTIRNVLSVEEGYTGTQKFDGQLEYGNPYKRIYEVKTGSIVHDGVTYNAGERFYAANANFTGTGTVYLVESVQATGWKTGGLTNSIIEQCTIYNVHGQGFDIEQADKLKVINCDAYNCSDIWAYPPQDKGDRGTGISVTDIHSYNKHVFVTGCRAWECGDQGFVGGTYGYVSFDSCWAFFNGALEGGGGGWKIGYWEDFVEGDTIKRRITNSLGVYNREYGITTNDAGEPQTCGLEIYNNTFYRNGDDGTWAWGGYGLYVYRSADTPEDQLLRMYKNNISYDNEVGAIYVSSGAYYTHENNSWDHPSPLVTISDDDFISLGGTKEEIFDLLSAPRNRDGSLPDLKGFLHLDSTSMAIDAGVDVGLPYHKDAPDLGAFEYIGVNKYPSVDIISPAIGSTFTGPATITITAKVNDPDGSISKVQFFNGKTSLDTLTTGPWSFTWTNVPVGVYYITVEATDNKGAKTTSSSVLVTVKSDIINLYPNPNNGIFTFDLIDPLQEDIELRIISYNGKVIYNEIMFSEELTKKFDFSYIDPGTYILILSRNEIIDIKTFIKE